MPRTVEEKGRMRSSVEFEVRAAESSRQGCVVFRSHMFFMVA